MLNKISLNKFLKFLGDLISFRTPISRILVFLFIFLFFFFISFESVKEFPVKCIYKNFILPFIFGGDCPENGLFKDCECPGCGMTRAFSELIHGNFTEAIKYNSIVIPLVILMIFFIFKDSIFLLKKYFGKNII